MNAVTNHGTTVSITHTDSRTHPWGRTAITVKRFGIIATHIVSGSEGVKVAISDERTGRPLASTPWGVTKAEVQQSEAVFKHYVGASPREFQEWHEQQTLKEKAE